MNTGSSDEADNNKTKMAWKANLISKPLWPPLLLDQLDPPPASRQTPICPPLLLRLLNLWLKAGQAHQLPSDVGQLCLLQVPLFHNVSDVDAGDGVDVDVVRGGTLVVVGLHPVGHLLLLCLLVNSSVEI